MAEAEVDRPETESQDLTRSSPFEPEDSNESPIIRPTEPDTAIQFIIPRTSYAPEYRSALPEAVEGAFTHLNCFQFTPYERFELPPTITVLKQHAKALCLLLHLLQPSPPGTGPYSWPKEVFRPPFDWLQDLERPYVPKGVPAEEWDVDLLELFNTRRPRTPIIENRPTAELIRDANIVLTTLHFTIQPKHYSLLSLNLGSPQKHPVLAEWISFTHELRNRVAAFKEEVRFLKETLISEAVVPTARCKELRREGAPESYSLEYPTDRYVLAGLSEGLWNRLTEELKGKERDEWLDRKEELAARQGAPKFDLVDDSDDDDDDDDDDDEPRVTWIETTSRLYTIKGTEQHIFVIPGFGANHGNMTLHRDQEEWLSGGHERVMKLLNERISELAREESELRQNIENERSNHAQSKPKDNPQLRLATKGAPQQPPQPSAVAGPSGPRKVINPPITIEPTTAQVNPTPRLRTQGQAQQPQRKLATARSQKRTAPELLHSQQQQQQQRQQIAPQPPQPLPHDPAATQTDHLQAVAPPGRTTRSHSVQQGKGGGSRPAPAAAPQQ